MDWFTFSLFSPCFEVEGKSHWLGKTVLSSCCEDLAGSLFWGQQDLNENLPHGRSAQSQGRSEGSMRRASDGLYKPQFLGDLGRLHLRWAMWVSLESWTRFFQGVKTGKTFLREGMACTKHGSLRETWVFRTRVSRILELEIRMPGESRSCWRPKGCARVDAQS